jgi:hypothetical protein
VKKGGREGGRESERKKKRKRERRERVTEEWFKCSCYARGARVGCERGRNG